MTRGFFLNTRQAGVRTSWSAPTKPVNLAEACYPNCIRMKRFSLTAAIAALFAIVVFLALRIEESGVPDEARETAPKVERGSWMDESNGLNPHPGSSNPNWARGFIDAYDFFPIKHMVRVSFHS